MDSKLLIGPVKRGTKREEVGIFHAAERCFDVVLGAICQNDLFVGPVASICEQDGLSQQGRAKLFPGGLIELAEELGDPIGCRDDLSGEEFFHVPAVKNGLDLFSGTGDGRFV